MTLIRLLAIGQLHWMAVRVLAVAKAKLLALPDLAEWRATGNQGFA